MCRTGGLTGCGTGLVAVDAVVIAVIGIPLVLAPFYGVRKLLLHRFEINKLLGKATAKGYTIVPLQVYFKGSLVKVQIGLAKGKKLYDKREDIAKKDLRREAERDFKVKNL